MANQEHLDILLQGTETWNSWRRRNRTIIPDLSGADLREAQLCDLTLSQALRYSYFIDRMPSASSDAPPESDPDIMAFNALPYRSLDHPDLLIKSESSNFTFRQLDEFSNEVLGWAKGIEYIISNPNAKAWLDGANLILANLSGADLSEAALVTANLIGADLRGANLSGSHLESAILVGTDLRMANLTNADLRGANFIGANLSNANLRKANLSGANLSGANLNGADLTECNVYAISAWNVKLNNAIQLGLTITPFTEPTITVDNLEMAQFIYLLLNNRKIRDIINSITSKAVLILGRFTRERKAVLDAIKEELRKHDYLPILFDFDKPSSQDLTETVSTLAHLSRFIIVDLTDPSSVPYEVGSIAPNHIRPIQALFHPSDKAKREFAMFSDLVRRYHWVLPPFEYQDQEHLLASFQAKVIAPAEQKAQELEKR